MPKQNRTRFAVLGLLSFGPHTGYDLKRRFEERMSHFWSESLGQIYPTLSRLEKEGHVSARRRQDGNRQRIEYTITTAGRQELARWLALPSAPQPVRNEMLLKLFLATPASLGDLAANVKHHRDQFTAQLASYEMVTTQIEEVAPSPFHERLWKLNLRLGELVTEARHAWCLETLAELAELSTQKGNS